MAEQHVVVGSLEAHVEVVGEGVPVVLLHGLGLSGALWHRVRDGFGPATSSSSPISAAPVARASSSERSSRWSAGPRISRGLLAALGVERPVLVGHSLGASIALKYALEHPDDVRALALIGADATLSNLAPRMLASAERIESMGLEDWVAEYWSTEPTVLPGVARARAGDPRRVPRPRARQRSGRLRPPMPCDCRSGGPRRQARARSHSRPSCSSERRTTEPCPSTVVHWPSGSATPASSSCRTSAIHCRSRRPRPSRPQLARSSRDVAPRTEGRECCAPTRPRGTRPRDPSATSTSAGSSGRNGRDADLVRPVDVSAGSNPREPLSPERGGGRDRRQRPRHPDRGRRRTRRRCPATSASSPVIPRTGSPGPPRRTS